MHFCITYLFIFFFLLFYVAFNSQIAMGSLEVEEISAYCTVNHRALASNYQLSNMKRPAQDLNRRPQRLEERPLTTTPPSPRSITYENKKKYYLFTLRSVYCTNNLSYIHVNTIDIQCNSCRYPHSIHTSPIHPGDFTLHLLTMVLAICKCNCLCVLHIVSPKH